MQYNDLHFAYPDEIQTWHHSFDDAIQWRLTPKGIEIKGEGLQRTAGAPVTMRRLQDQYGDFISLASEEFMVPEELIYATIATESSGKPHAEREEPGFVSDEQTPHRVSAGLMQTLISTARSALKQSTGHEVAVDRNWLMDPENSIRAGTAYIGLQGEHTQFDPPLVAAAYNAGGVYYQGGVNNRWKLRQYPIGTGKHCDRFVKWYGDAMAILKEDAIDV